MNYFISVNFGTSFLIERWVKNIRSVCNNPKIILVDNYKDTKERKNVKDLAKKLQFDLICSDNVGYGRALNKGISHCFEIEGNNYFNVFAGNLDIEYYKFPLRFPKKGKYVYVPTVKEGAISNRNPFLTKAQRLVLPFYHISARYNSIPMLYASISLNKLMSFLPSKLWAVHGSLFCFSSECVSGGEQIFNENSFLYCEELEFASYMQDVGATYIIYDIGITHDAHVATSKIMTSKKEFFNLWSSSFNNWYARWN